MKQLAAVVLLTIALPVCLYSQDSDFIQGLIARSLKGDITATYLLGNAYAEGEGVEKDEKVALGYFARAAELGDTSAMCRMGEECLNGKDVWTLANLEPPAGTKRVPGQPDYISAFQWFQKAADQGHSLGQNYLGIMYAEGMGVPQDYAESYVWFSLATSFGHKVAPRGRNAMAKLLTPQALESAQARAKQLFQEIQNRQQLATKQ